MAIAGNSSTTAVATVGSVNSSTLATLGEHDWYQVALNAGQTITITLTGGGNLDTYLNIYDPAGTTILASNDDIVAGVNTNSRLTFTAATAGTYFIDVGASNNQTTGTYDLFVEPSPAPVFTNDQIAFQLTNGYWGGDVHHWAVTPGGTLTVNISTMSAADQTLGRVALQEWSDVIGVHFQEVSSGGQIVFSDAEDTSVKGPIAQTDASWSSRGIISSAHVHISQSWVTNYGTGLDSYSLQTYVHEIGHALGLGHGGEYNDTATYPTDALYANDSWSTTIMSYFDQRQNSYFAAQGFSRLYVLTPMAADIVAMQSLYGLSTTTRAGDTTYGYNSNVGGIYDATLYPKAAFTIFDSGGNNTIDYSGSAANQLINLNPGTFSNVNGYTGNLSIAPGTLIQNAIGGSGNDTIIANSANDVLTGGPGADTLIGGSGNDTFLDTIANHNGDTIQNFHPGDHIIFTDASLGSFTFSLSGNTLTYSGGSMTVQGSTNGIWTTTTAAGGGVDLLLRSAAPAAVHNDFNGDGRSDVLWQNDDGTVTDWIAQADGSFLGNHLNVNPGLSWHIVGTGDFNGDGRSDVLWQNDNGTITDWLAQPDGSLIGNHLNLNPGVSWHVVGTGDFNGDGKADVLLRNSDGTITEWLGQSNGSFATTSFSVNPGTSWHVIGTGDFNGDGRTDILWQNDSGLVTEWLAQPDGTFVGHPLNVNPGTGWQAVGIGDFNGDGRDDIVWQNASGTINEWLAQSDGSFVAKNLNVNPGAGWHIVSTGDFNGDHRSDLLLRNDSGQITEWAGQADGSFVAGQLSINPGINWHVHDPLVHNSLV